MPNVNNAISCSEYTLVLFVTRFTNQQLFHGTIQVYLSPVRILHITKKEYHTFIACVTPWLDQVLKGIQKTHALTHSSKEWHLIIFPNLEWIHPLLSNQTDNYYNLMIWVTYCTAYFGLVRVSKFFASSPNHISSYYFTDLLLSYLAIDSPIVPHIIRIILKQSKTDQYRLGTHIYLGRTSHQVCPVKALIRYLDRRGGRPGQLLYYLPIS